MTYESTICRNRRGELEAETIIDMGHDSRQMRITTSKGYNGGISSYAQVGQVTGGGSSGYTGFQFAMGLGSHGDYSKVLAKSAARCTEKALRLLHAQALEGAAAALAEALATHPEYSKPEAADVGPYEFSFDGGTYTLASMLFVNECDPALCDWLRTAKPGDCFSGCECLASTADHAEEVPESLADIADDYLNDFNNPGSRHHY